MEGVQTQTVSVRRALGCVGGGGRIFTGLRERGCDFVIIGLVGEHLAAAQEGQQVFTGIYTVFYRTEQNRLIRGEKTFYHFIQSNVLYCTIWYGIMLYRFLNII